MKTFLIISICSMALALGLAAQSPTASPAASATVSAGAVSPSPTAADDLESAIEKKVKRHFNFTIGDNDSDTEHTSGSSHSEDVPEMVVPIVAVVFLSIFGAPVLIVGLIMYFTFSRNRMMHRTVRMMVEKGQPVPAALLAPPAPAVRQRSDMRRGVVLVMVGTGLMLFFAAMNDWEGGAWTLGLIPFLIGVGYLLVWKLEGGKKEIPPLPPTA